MTAKNLSLFRLWLISVANFPDYHLKLRIAISSAFCGHPGLLENGYIEGSSYSSGDRITFSCKTGYKLIGRNSNTCDQRTAKWLPRKPECRRKLPAMLMNLI